MQKPPKRACPGCGLAVRVVKSTNIAKTQLYVERFQELKCLGCGMRGLLTTKEYVEWLVK